MDSKELRSGIKRKHVTLTIINKLKVIEQLENGVSGKKIAQEFGISQQTVSDIKKQKESIKTFALKFDVGNDKSSVSNRQTLKKPKEVLLEEAVLKWYSQQRSSGVDVRGDELRAAAEEFAKHLKIHNFTCSSGWLWRFRQRHNITKRKICREALSDVESVEPFRKKINEIIQSGICNSQIYNAGETGLFWRGLPENTQAFHREQSTPRQKTNQERVSALFCANSDGNHQLKLDEGDPGFQQPTGGELAADVIKDSAIKEESDNELDRLQESTIKKKLLSSARDGIDAVISYVLLSTNQKLQECYEHLRTVREILIKEQQQMSVQAKLDSFFKPALLSSKTKYNF
jgi:transposase